MGMIIMSISQGCQEQDAIVCGGTLYIVKLFVVQSALGCFCLSSEVRNSFL